MVLASKRSYNGEWVENGRNKELINSNSRGGGGGGGGGAGWLARIEHTYNLYMYTVIVAHDDIDCR